MKIYNITFTDLEDFLLKIDPPKNLKLKQCVQLAGHEITLKPRLKSDLKLEWMIIKIK